MRKLPRLEINVSFLRSVSFPPNKRVCKTVEDLILSMGDSHARNEAKTKLLPRPRFQLQVFERRLLPPASLPRLLSAVTLTTPCRSLAVTLAIG